MKRRHIARLATRLSGFLEWAREAADRGTKDLDTLAVSAELSRAKLKGRRRNSRLPALVDLLLSRPLVSVPMAAKALRCLNQAVEAMLPLLGSIPRELTGRGRYRALGVV
ncbi:MAG: helix-turn-helix domain-containing protein [Hyphomicrobiales bacterium]|nr:helix-turn-helix domain-containing protein [Hyphomicrobiales bacterium]